MSKLANVWVFSDNVERYAELMAGARLWGEQVHLIVLGNEQASQVKPLGADEIVVLEATSGLQRVENFAETIAALIQEHTGLLLMPATKRAKSLGARLSIQLNAAMVNDATSVTLDDGSLFAEHRMYGGLAFGKEKIKTTQAIITLAPGVLEPVEANASHTCPVVSAPYIAPHHEIMCQERRAKSVSSVDLSKAKRVVVWAAAWLRKTIWRWCTSWHLYWVQKWVVHDRLPKAKTGWNANATSAFLACY